MSLSLKRRLALFVVAIAVAASAAGAYAATSSSPANGRQAFLTDVAHRLHVTPQQLRKAVQGAFADRLAAAVKAGRLSKAQASAIAKRLTHFGGLPFGAGPGMLALPPGLAKRAHAGFGPGGPLPPAFYARPGARGRPNAHFRPGWHPYPPIAVPRGAPAGPAGFAFGLGMMPSAAKAALSYLGLSPAQLKSELKAGKSLAQIAAAHGKSAKGLESAVVSALKAQMSKQVAAHHLPPGWAKHFLAKLSARVAAIGHGRMPTLPWAVVPGARGFGMLHPLPGRFHSGRSRSAKRKPASAAGAAPQFQSD